MSKEQIETQSLEELQNSLGRVNEAMQKPELFGNMGIALSTDGVPYIAKGEANIREVGILPLLLERKKIILERIASLKKNQWIENL